MFKSLFSKMLVTNLAVLLALIILVGATAAAVFVNHYKTERENDLHREANEIITVVNDKYLVPERQNAALDELLTIARKYDGVIQLVFSDRSVGRLSVSNNSEGSKWAMYIDYYKRADEYDRESVSSDGVIVEDMFNNISKMPTMTIIMPVDNSEGKSIGKMFFTIDMSETDRAIKSVVVDVVVFITLGVLFALLAELYLTDRMTRPIAEMTKIVRQFSKGKYDARIDVVGEDEVSELAASFNKMAEAVNNLEQVRRSFVANVSHELRSPLTSMKGFLVAIQDGTIAPEDAGKYLSIVTEECNRMTAMVNDLLDMARLESGENKLHITLFEVTETIITTLITFEARINAKHIDVSVKLGEKPIYVEADKQQIIQVLRNLIDNAVKFTPDGGKLEITLLEQKEIVWISIKDSGAGIPDEDIPFIFDRFYKVEKAHTRSKASGTGLGLAIVKNIINSHGQSIYVKNDDGANFMFSLKKAQRRIQLKFRPSSEKSDDSDEKSDSKSDNKTDSNTDK